MNETTPSTCNYCGRYLTDLHCCPDLNCKGNSGKAIPKDATYMTIQFPFHEDQDICLINGIASLLQWHKNQSGTEAGRKAALSWAYDRQQNL